MTDDLQAVYAKIAKLRALATSPNQHEAAAAAAKAEELVQRYRVSEAEIGAAASAPSEGLVSGPIADFGRQVPRWSRLLVNFLEQRYGCAGWRRYHLEQKRYTFLSVGRASDLSTLRYMFAWLSGEILRLVALHGKGRGRRWRESYSVGLVYGIAEKMREAEAAARRQASSSALAVLDARLAASVEARLRCVLPGAEQVDDDDVPPYRPGAFFAGVAHGKRIEARPAIEGAGVGRIEGSVSRDDSSTYPAKLPKEGA